VFWIKNLAVFSTALAISIQVSSQECPLTVMIQTEPSMEASQAQSSLVESIELALSQSGLSWLPEEVSAIDSELELQLIGLATGGSDQPGFDRRFAHLTVAEENSEFVISAEANGVTFVVRSSSLDAISSVEFWKKYLATIGEFACAIH